MKNGSKDYARFLPLLDHHKELQKDFDIEWLQTASGYKNKSVKNQLFIGGKTLLHQFILQLVQTFLCNYMGEKNGVFIVQNIHP